MWVYRITQTILGALRASARNFPRKMVVLEGFNHRQDNHHKQYQHR